MLVDYRLQPDRQTVLVSISTPLVCNNVLKVTKLANLICIVHIEQNGSQEKPDFWKNLSGRSTGVVDLPRNKQWTGCVKIEKILL